MKTPMICPCITTQYPKINIDTDGSTLQTAVPSTLRFPFLQIVGSVWYVFGLERIDTCWQQFYCTNATCPHYHFSCSDSNYLSPVAREAIRTNCTAPEIFFVPNASQTFDYGIYAPLLLLIQTERGWQNYLYSFWWGLQQIW